VRTQRGQEYSTGVVMNSKTPQACVCTDARVRICVDVCVWCEYLQRMKCKLREGLHTPEYFCTHVHFPCCVLARVREFTGESDTQGCENSGSRSSTLA
jgi:hypothetical protein